MFGHSLQQSQVLPQPPQLPQPGLALAWAFGASARAGVATLAGGERAVYAVGAVVVVTNFEGKQEFFLRGHSSEVTALGTGEKEIGNFLVVSGQRDPKGVGRPYALVWEEKKFRTAQPVARLDGPEKEVRAVAVARGGERIAVAGGDEYNSIFVYRNFQLVHTLATGKSIISYLCWGERSDNDGYLAAGCEDKVKLWESGNFQGASGCAKSLVLKTAAALFFDGNCGLLLEKNTGKIFSFPQKLQLRQFPETRHFCWIGNPGDRKFMAVAADRSMYWGVLDAETGQWKISDRKNMQFPTEKICCVSGNFFLTTDHTLGRIAENGNVEIFQISPAKEAWALAVHPSKALAVTGDFSGRLLFFDLANKRPLTDRIVNCGLKIFCAAFSPDGRHLAVGQEDGWVTILKVDDCKEIFQRKIGDERVTELNYTPDGQNLVAGCWDQNLYVIRKNLQVAGKLKGHSSSPVSMQFSRDGKFVISDSKDGQTLCWRLSDGERVTRGVKELGCAADGWTGVLAEQVAAIWEDERYGDRSDINTVAQKNNCIAVGDDLGSVKLFPFPCPRGTAACDQQHHAHYAAVTKVAFAPNGMLLSLGGIDHGLFLWNTVPDGDDTQHGQLQQAPQSPRVRRSWELN